MEKQSPSVREVEEARMRLQGRAAEKRRTEKRRAEKQRSREVSSGEAENKESGELRAETEHGTWRQHVRNGETGN